MTTRRMRCEDEVEAMAVTEGGSLGKGEARPPSRSPTLRTGDFLGKHRLSAAINRLNQEIQSLQVSSLSLPPYLPRPTDFFLLSLSVPRYESRVGWMDHVLLAWV